MEPSNEGSVRVERWVRRCPICNEADGAMVNYSLTDDKELPMHDICAARHFQNALKEILDLYVCVTVDMSGIPRKAPGAGGIAQRALGIKARE